ncbi:MAG: hypothetical protein ABIQ18_10100 [Umezawaea sp.]
MTALGVRAVVTGEALGPKPERTRRWQRSGAEALLAAPLVRLLGTPGDRRIVVGKAQVAVDADSECAVTLLVQAVWSERGGWHQEAWDRTDVGAELLAALASPAHQIAGDAKEIAVMTAKGLAEGSRDAVAGVRGLRYEAERQVADLLTQRRSTALRPLLAQVVELSQALSRARDHAREAVRDGLWIFLWDADTYQLNRGEPATTSHPWTVPHRNALRHCEAMDVELADEATRLQTLLSSVATFAVAQDGEAQQRFNTLAAAAGLGLPALILSLYGADTFLPFSFDTAWRALTPIAVIALVAVTITLRRMPGKASPRHFLGAIGLVVALVLVLLVAGLLAPGS